MTLHVGPVWWTATLLVLAAFLAFDLFVSRGRTTPRRATFWVLFYAGAALAFGALLTWDFGFEVGGQFLAAWITEYSLSIDNLFVFLVLLNRFAVPERFQLRVLTFGIVVALALRAVLIAVGAIAIARFSWLFYLFAVFLIWTAVGLLREALGRRREPPALETAAGPDGSPPDPVGVRLLRKVVPTVSDWDHGHLTVRRGGRRLATPMLITMAAIGVTDVFFALDSIPAIFGLTTVPFLIVAANAFALVGLRQLFFVVRALLDRLAHLDAGLAAVLLFIGAKLVLEALHENTLPFVNGGEGLDVPVPSTAVSLLVVVGLLVLTALTSLVAARRSGDAGPRERVGSAGGG
ncbi:TerC/Alx family metal homeostasis membrane protein [Spongisporangium articulatum]|uniref:TerC/Alx family metal homeostasis membrane protein n=1 Tax=Spongisporangium articulatum TaxID=3362603 RepID=A0ABW8AR28_9ACTN